MEAKGNTAVFMDRDGTINEERGYLRDPDGLNIMPEAFDAIKLINKNKLKAVVVTNQSGIARGYISEKLMEKVHQKLTRLLMQKGAYLDGIYYCPHHTEGDILEYCIKCKCRKPATGMLDLASQELDIDLHRSYVIGDKIIDIELAHGVGAKGILVLTGYGKDEADLLNQGSRVQPQFIANNILDAVNWILSDLRLNTMA